MSHDGMHSWAIGVSGARFGIIRRRCRPAPLPAQFRHEVHDYAPRARGLAQQAIWAGPILVYEGSSGSFCPQKLTDGVKLPQFPPFIVSFAASSRESFAESATLDEDIVCNRSGISSPLSSWWR
jgi:hypothetical protein